MIDDDKTFLFNCEFLNNFLGSNKLFHWNFAFNLRLFLGDRDHLLDHFLLGLDSLNSSKFWDKTFSLLRSFLNRRLHLVTTDKMFDNCKTLLFICDLLYSLLRDEKFTQRNFTFSLLLFLSIRDHTLNHIRFSLYRLSFNEFRYGVFSFLHRFLNRSLNLVTANKMVYDRKTLLFIHNLFNLLLNSHKLTKRNATLRLQLSFYNSDHPIDHFLLGLNGLSLSEFWDEALNLLNRFFELSLNIVTTDKMCDDTKTFLFTYGLLNRFVSLYKFRERYFTLCLWLFLNNQNHVLNHHQFSLYRLSLGKFWNETFGFLNRLLNRCLSLIASNEMIDDTKTFLFTQNLLNHFFG